MSLSGDFETYSVPLPPPLPPNSSVPFSNSSLTPKTFNISEFSKINENELDLAIKRLFMCDVYFSKVFYLSNTYLTPQLQDGPKCGLVALSIATSGTENFVSVDEIFQTAVSKGLTKQGEMFSANSLALLAEKCCRFKTRVITNGLNTHFDCIIKSLLRKHLLLVPYDADYNHSPCCKKGSKAHWALITGFLIAERNVESKNAESDDFVILNSLKSTAPCNCHEGNGDIDLPLTASVHEEKILIGKRPPNKIYDDVRNGKLYLIGMQGKSPHVGLWLFDEMAKSNDNLVLFSASRNSEGYVLPRGGVEEGLKGKAVILEYPDHAS